jgi:hypothetical protein
LSQISIFIFLKAFNPDQLAESEKGKKVNQKWSGKNLILESQFSKSFKSLILNQKLMIYFNLQNIKTIG